MKKCVFSIYLTIKLLFLCSLAPNLFGSEYWPGIAETEKGDWAKKEKEVAKTLQNLQEQVEAARIKIAESPGLPGESQEAALTRIFAAESQALEQERQEREQKRQAQEEAELAEILKASTEQAELENRQRAEREELERQEREEKAQKEREEARLEQERQEREEQRLERERVIAQETILAEQQAAQEKERIKIAEQAVQAQKEREQKAREEGVLKAEQTQQEQEAKALADALRAVKELEDKERARKALADVFKQSLLQAPAQSTPSKYRPDESLEDINKQLEQFEQREYEQELKQSAPFFEAYEQAVSPENMPRINIIRPEVIQQKQLECGYYSAINGALLYNAFRSRQPDALRQILTMLKNRNRIDYLLKRAQDKLGCPKTLEDYQIIGILADLYNIPLESGAYSMYYEQLPDGITKLNKLNLPIITTLEKLSSQKGFTHIFFLRKSGADVSNASLGHWISVVAHNNDNQSIDLYVLDSQYPQSNSATYATHRMNHDKMWQALAILLNQTNQTRQALLALISQAAQNPTAQTPTIDEPD